MRRRVIRVGEDAGKMEIGERDKGKEREREMGKEDRDYAILSVSVCTCLYSEEMVRLHSDSCRCLLRMPNGM